jgi:TPR repeat protein
VASFQAFTSVLKHILAGVALALTLTGGAVAEPFQEAVAAYQRGDYATAARLLRPLAEQGNASAQNNLGMMYKDGQSVTQDYAEAIKWFRLAAKQGDAGGQSNLGRMYDNGLGVAKDTAEAIKWYRLAADQGSATAQNNLGSMYAKGEGLPQDYVLAHMWFSLAISRFLAWEIKDRDRAMRNRDLVASKMTSAQLAEAHQLAREWKPKSPAKQ